MEREEMEEGMYGFAEREGKDGKRDAVEFGSKRTEEIASAPGQRSWCGAREGSPTHGISPRAIAVRSSSRWIAFPD